MKQLIMILLLSCSAATFAQEQTLLSGTLEHGGYGGPVAKVGAIYGTTGLLIGGQGGWIVNHSYILGGGGYGTVSKITPKQELRHRYTLPDNTRLEFGYGGLFIGYTANSDQLVHWTVTTLIGSGHVSLTRKNNDEKYDWDDDNVSSTGLFVVEPELSAELNMTSFFRLQVGVNYRFVSGMDIDGLKNSDFSGPGAAITFKFGSF